MRRDLLAYVGAQKVERSMIATLPSRARNLEVQITTAALLTCAVIRWRYYVALFFLATVVYPFQDHPVKTIVEIRPVKSACSQI